MWGKRDRNTPLANFVIFSELKRKEEEKMVESETNSEIVNATLPPSTPLAHIFNLQLHDNDSRPVSTFPTSGLIDIYSPASARQRSCRFRAQLSGSQVGNDP